MIWSSLAFSSSYFTVFRLALKSMDCVCLEPIRTLSICSADSLTLFRLASLACSSSHRSSDWFPLSLSTQTTHCTLTHKLPSQLFDSMLKEHNSFINENCWPLLFSYFFVIFGHFNAKVIAFLINHVNLVQIPENSLHTKQSVHKIADTRANNELNNSN